MTADLMREGLAVVIVKHCRYIGDALEADFVAAWLGRCLQEKGPPDRSVKKKAES